MSLFQMLAASLALASVLVASHVVDVHSATNCPSARDIAERLRPLLPDAPAGAAAPDLATIEPVDTRGTDTDLRIRLVRASGAKVGDRRVVVRGDCAEAAATVAAVIAAWKIEPLPSAITPAPSARPASSTAAKPSSWQVWLGAAGGVGIVGGVAAVGRIEALTGRGSSRVRGRIGLLGESARSRSLATGRVDWRHTAFELGMLLRTQHPKWPLSIDAGLVLGWATVAGDGFDPNRQQRSFEYGASTAVRLARTLGRWSAWTEVRLYAWALGQRASVAGDQATSIDLPRIDATASLGISAALF